MPLVHFADRNGMLQSKGRIDTILQPTRGGKGKGTGSKKGTNTGTQKEGLSTKSVHFCPQYCFLIGPSAIKKTFPGKASKGRQPKKLCPERGRNVREHKTKKKA